MLWYLENLIRALWPLLLVLLLIRVISWLLGLFVHYLEDLTTGFLKVKQLVQLQARESRIALAQRVAQPGFQNYKLTLGELVSSPGLLPSPAEAPVRRDTEPLPVQEKVDDIDRAMEDIRKAVRGFFKPKLAGFGQWLRESKLGQWWASDRVSQFKKGLVAWGQAVRQALAELKPFLAAHFGRWPKPEPVPKPESESQPEPEPIPEDIEEPDLLNLPDSFRSTHMYVVGASGTGKSSLLKNLLVQDVQSSLGFCLIDPHGDLVYDLVPFLGERARQTVILDLGDTEHMLAYNILERREGVMVAEQVAKLILAFKRIWHESWGPRMEDILRHTLTLLIEQGYTLAEFERLLVDADFREMLLEKTDIPQTREFFVGRFNEWNARERAVFIESSLNKVSAFLADDRIGARLSQAKSDFNLREIMDSGEILLVNLAKGRLAGNADLFGALLMADIEMSFLSREQEQRRPFALYVDEFQNIATESFGTVLAEARKFGLWLTIAHQTLKQVDEKLVSLILGNARVQVFFRVSRQDAEILAKETANVAKEVEGKYERLMQEPEIKLNLGEMWEIAFHKLAGLKPREAYVMIKGAMDAPEKIMTLDNPVVEGRDFPFGEGYRVLGELKIGRQERVSVIEAQVKEFMGADKKKPPDDRGDSPNDLGFLK